MNIWQIFLIAVGLSMDAFAVSICKGLSVSRVKAKQYLTVGLYFGAFQALMPLIGYLLGSRFEPLVTSIDHWIAFVLLGLIGANMIRESFSNESCPDGSFGFRSMVLLAIATSIDALAVGITFAFLNVSILPSVILIGCTTFGLSMVGMKIGNVFGDKYKSSAELAGGIMLILMGIVILAEHLGIIG